MSYRKTIRITLVGAACLGLLLSSGCRRRKYENPITKDTQQPDKVLFDKAIKDIERSRFEVARLTLQTLINTYDTSEYLAKAKLAIADSWFREGGSHALAQAEAEYKDFILFYPTLEEAAESQEKICMIHYKQMEKPDRDPNHALRAEDECRQVLVQFPNSKFAPRVQQLLRNIQEVIAEGEFRVGSFYHNKGSFPAAANRLQNLTDHYPLFSGAPQALWTLGDSYSKMGPRFQDKAYDAFARIVKEYPTSGVDEDAKKRLAAAERPIPEPDPVALARMKYEQENRTKPGFFSPVLGVLRKSPDTRMAAKSGSPAMTTMRPSIPASVPPPGSQEGAGTTDVTVSTVSDTSALENNPDARQRPPQPAGGDAAAAPAQPEAPAAAAPAAPQQKQKKTNNKKKSEPAAAKPNR